MACLSRPYHFKFFKGCLPQILLGPLFNTLSHILILKLSVTFSMILLFRRRCLRKHDNLLKTIIIEVQKFCIVGIKGLKRSRLSTVALKKTKSMKPQQTNIINITLKLSLIASLDLQ